MNANRRSFLKELAAGIIVAPWVTTGLRAQSPNSKIRHATFGCAGMALDDVTKIASHESVEVVAACDVDASKIPAFLKKFPNAKIYADFRELLEKEKDLQTVNVSTPDHMHAAIGMTALNRGLHVYGQKPLTHNLYECRKLTEAAREKKLITQMGIQIHSSSQYRTAVKLVRDGAIGKVKEVHTWSSKKWGDNGAMPVKTEEPPKDLNWDLWLGVAAERPYIGGEWYQPSNWRKRLDFGTGTFGDMGCHIYDPVFKALALTFPLSVKSRGAAPNEHSWATDAIVEYVFPGTEFTAGKTANVTWYDGDQRPPKEIQEMAMVADDEKLGELPEQGSILIGTEGILVIPHVDAPRLIGKKFADFKIEKVEKDNHWHQFIEAALGNRKNCDANFDYSGPMTEAVLLGSVASRFPNQLLEWDGPGLKFTNVAKANEFVKRTYRKGFEVAGL